jgi:pyruvate dehydrogenase E2 component (dihydrolipoamide acetyltransferase)
MALQTLRGSTQKMTAMRKLIAKRMLHSLQVSAQLTTVVEADMEAVSATRRRMNLEAAQSGGSRLGYFAFVAKAAVECLVNHPVINACIDEDDLAVTYHDDEHLAIAVDTPRGLMAPVIRNANRLDVTGIASEIEKVARLARACRLSPRELQGGTFTITNTGSRGALFDTPIINQPQVAILGVGAVTPRPVVVHDGDQDGVRIGIHPMVYLSLSYDHRLIDGSDAAGYLVDVRARLEGWDEAGGASR